MVKTGIQDNNVFGVVYAYTLENDTWIYDQYIFPNEHISNDLFGATISLEGNRMVVGALGEGVTPNFVTEAQKYDARIFAGATDTLTLVENCLS